MFALPDPLHPAAVHRPIALAVLAAGIQVGHSGGELVYRHGAASAYAPREVAGGTAVAPRWEHEEDDD